MAEKTGLSKFEKFGLISGVVGLVADVIGLAALIKFLPNFQVVSSDRQTFPFLILWLITFIGISYSVFIFNYYFLRTKLRQNEAKLNEAMQNLSSDIFSFGLEKENEIKKGIEIVTSLVTIPLYFLHFLILYYIFYNDYLVLLTTLLKDAPSNEVTLITGISLGLIIASFGVGISMLMTGYMNDLANKVYNAFED